MAKQKKPVKKMGGPFLAAAFFCEAFLDDAGGRVSAIGITDGCNFYIAPEAPPDVPSKHQPMVINQNILIVFRSGDSPGRHKLRVVIERPDGERKQAFENDIELSAPPHGGCNIKTQASLAVYSPGLYWFDVYLDGKQITRMPLNVTIQRLPLAQSSIQSIEIKK